MTLVVLGLAWLAGLFIAGALNAPWWLPGASLSLALPCLLAFAPRYWLWIGCCAALLATLAGWRAASVSHEAPGWTGLVGQEVVLNGRIESEPDPGFSTVTYEVSVTGLTAPFGHEGGGRILVLIPQFEPRLPLHTEITVRGNLDLPPRYDDFDYLSYLREHDIFASMFGPAVTIRGQPGAWDYRYQLARLRLHIEDGLRRSLPEPEASLAAGIAFGRDESLSSETKDDFTRSGLAHLTAVSGSNVSLVVALFILLLAPNIGRKWATWTALAGVIAYVALAGASPSVLRAGIMAGVYLFGWFIGRPQSGLAALSAAAILMTLVSPATGADPGFQLSLAATAGLLTFGPWLHVAGRRLSTWPVLRHVYHERLAMFFALSIAASASTMPIVAYHFGRVSLTGIVTNLVAEPIFVASFVGGWVVAIAGMAWPAAGWAAGLAVYYPLALLAWLAEVAAGWPGNIVVAKEHLMPSLAGIVVLVAFAGAAYLRPPIPGERVISRSIPRPVLAGGAGMAVLAAVAALGFAPAQDSGELRIDFLDVGQGDAILVTTPGGTQMLVDGGPSGFELIRELSAVMPHWDRTLDAVVLTHGDQDHVAGLALLTARYDVDSWLDNGQPRTTPAFAAYKLDATSRRSLVAGDSWSVDGVKIDVLWPPKGFPGAQPNEASIVLRLTFGEVTFLLTGDLEGPPLAVLAKDPAVRTTVLKVPHHGSKTTTPAFLAANGAALAVIEAGCENQFGHPTKQTLDALVGATVLRTDIDGRVTMTTNGERITVHTERRNVEAEAKPGASPCRR